MIGFQAANVHACSRWILNKLKQCSFSEQAHLITVLKEELLEEKKWQLDSVETN